MYDNKILKSGYVKWKELIPLQNEHFKEMSKDEFAKLEKSFEKNGSLMAWTIWENKDKKYLLDGVGRKLLFEEKEKQGLKPPDKVYCNYLDCKNKKEAAKAVLILSSQYRRITETGLLEFTMQYDLHSELPELSTEIDLANFDMPNYLESNYETEPAKDLDEIPAVPKKALSKLGDLFVIDGKHRVLCGDSTRESDVLNLMDGKKADMVFTDPPYGMRLDTDYSKIKGKKKFTAGIGITPTGKKYNAVIGDDKDFNPEYILKTFVYCNEIFLWGADYYAERLTNKNDGSWIVWDKRGNEDTTYSVINKMDKMFGSCFELCWSKKRHKREIARVKWVGMFGATNQPNEDKSRNHPTEKPVKLCEWFLARYNTDSRLIIDLFLGSGSTLIGSENAGKTCYGIEIDPVYIDVILKRYKNIFPEAKFKCLNRDFDFDKLFLN